MLGRALHVLWICQSLFSGDDLFLERFELATEPLALLVDIDEARERHDDLASAAQHGVGRALRCRAATHRHAGAREAADGRRVVVIYASIAR